jgi:hypothetical protein
MVIKMRKPQLKTILVSFLLLYKMKTIVPPAKTAPIFAGMKNSDIIKINK